MINHHSACYHGVSVVIQFLKRDWLPVLEEQVLKEALKDQTRHRDNKIYHVNYHQKLIA